MMARKGTDFAFALTRTVDDGRTRMGARFICWKCGASYDVNVPGAINPGLAVKTVKKHGWEASEFNPRSVLCQECSRKPRRKIVAPTTVNGAAPERPVLTLASATPPPTPRVPTNDQRVAIRALLDKYFDDSTGAYLDGYSDEKVAEAAKVPRAFVESIRDAAYGPVRVSPAVSALRAELEKFKADMAKRLDEFAGKLAKLERS